MMIDKTATLAELETAVKANCNAIKRETEMDLSTKDKSKAIIKEMFYRFYRRSPLVTCDESSAIPTYTKHPKVKEICIDRSNINMSEGK